MSEQIDPRQEFVAQKTLAVVGVSRKRGFGNLVFRHLRDRGYRVFAVHPEAESLEGAQAFACLEALPEKPDGVVIVVAPAAAVKVVEDCARLGIPRVWLQQGAESPEAIRVGEEKGLSIVHHDCIMMHAQPTGVHAFHRWVKKLFGGR